MNTRTKRRMIAVTGLIVIVLVVVLAVVGGNSSARAMGVAEALAFDGNSKIQVTGNVVDNSFEIRDNVLSFDVYDAVADPAAAAPLRVSYNGGVSATFGNGVTAICTGRKNAEGTLECTELVTKCPSKYENATDALTIDELASYGSSVIDKPVKVKGAIQDDSLAGVDADVRFVLEPTAEELAELSGQTDTITVMQIRYSGALSDETVAAAHVILTGSLSADGTFLATNVSLEK